MGERGAAPCAAGIDVFYADERRFLDLPRCSIFLTEEHELFRARVLTTQVSSSA